MVAEFANYSQITCNVFLKAQVWLLGGQASMLQATQSVMSIIRVALHIRTGAMCLRSETIQDLALGAQERILLSGLPSSSMSSSMVPL